MKEFTKSFLPLLKKYPIEVFLVVAALIITCISVGLIIYSNRVNETEIQMENEITEQKPNTMNLKIMVDINGAVKKAGVYELNNGSRLKDAILLAQGLSKEADNVFFARNFNLARILTDQEKIYIPSISEVANGIFIENSQTLDYFLPRRSPADGGTEAGPSEMIQTTININTASLDELDTLPGVGQVTAQKIIQNRPYLTIDELLTKKIVKKNIFEQIKSLITL